MTSGEAPVRTPVQAPTSQRELALRKFVEGGLNRAPEAGSTLAVGTDLSPRNLVSMCQNALPGIAVQLRGSNAVFTPLGFRQTLNLTFASTAASGGLSSSAASSGGNEPLSMRLTILQCQDYASAAEAFKRHVGAFQSNWHNIMTRTEKGFGNYAYQTKTSIFWTRWTTFVVLENTLKTGKADVSPTFPIDFKALASDVDQTFLSQRMPMDIVSRVSIDKANIPTIVVGHESILKFSFQPHAHMVTNVQVKDSKIIMFGGSITPTRELRLVGVAPGTATISIQVAHETSLQTTSQDFIIKVVQNAPASG
ncbi:hypothetical protein CGGC5_v015414 [Colletotrichum fructicola Nara gc5]|uniref:Uncharacterized protein n=1 Tax=Colletotrichum fructicola (strain Nara gc5) TaxID=1213859 RepID=L2FXJ0_COLFN|nr:hypothetical protein CGGC5_v015414 [Colletotrichum fructicola Nara gc5]